MSIIIYSNYYDYTSKQEKPPVAAFLDSN